MNNTNQIRQYFHEIKWIENKIKTKKSMRMCEFYQMQYEIRHREYAIMFLSC